MGFIYWVNQLYFWHLGCTDARKYYSGWSAGHQPGLAETKTISAQTEARIGTELGNYPTIQIGR